MQRNVTKRKITAAVVSGVVLLGAGLSACGRDESSATLLAEAKQFEQKGDQKAALIQLKNAVAKRPDDAEARFALGALHLDMGDAVSAEKELRKAASLGMDRKRTLPLLGQALLARGLHKDVLDAIPADLASQSAPLAALRGDAYLEQQDTDKAKQAYEQALALDPDNGAAMIGLARHALMQKDSARAEQFSADAIAKDKSNPETWMFRGAMLRGAGKPDEALAAYDKVIALKPNHRNAYIEKAFIEIDAGKFDAAKATIAAASKNAPGSLLVVYAQAMLDFSQGRNTAALDSLQKILKSAPEHMPSILLAGAVELNLGSVQQAEQHLRKYLGTFPDNVYARKLLAQAQLKSAQPVDAATTLAPALKDSAEDAQLLALAGQSSMQARQFDKAAGYFEKAAALAPKVAALHTSLGLSRLGQGDQARGLAELELGASLDAKSANSGMALVQAELQLKHFDKALAAAQALAKRQPANPQVHNQLGTVYAAKGDLASARASFEKAVALQADYFPAVASLAQLDMQQQKPEAAKARFTALLQKDPKNLAAMGALADLAMAERNTEEAMKWLEKASNDSPEAVAPAVRLGNLYLRLKQPQKALTLARKAQTANPANPDLLDLLGQSQMASGNAAEAMESFSKLVNVMPKSAAAQYRLATAHAGMKNEAAAAEDLKRALALQPDFLPAQLAQAELAVRQNKLDAALAIARQLQKQPANAAPGLVLEGDLLLRQQKPAAALPLYEKAFALQKTPQLIMGIHRLMVLAGKEQEADQRLAQWQKEHPADIQTLMYAAERNLGKKQYQQAVPQFVAVLKASPNNPFALNNLAWTYQQLKDPKALETAEAAYKISGDTPPVMDTLGTILVERGDFKRALPLLQKAVELAPDSTELRLHLAQARAKSGDKAGARKDAEQVVAKGDAAPGAAEARALLKQL